MNIKRVWVHYEHICFTDEKKLYYVDPSCLIDLFNHVEWDVEKKRTRNHAKPNVDQFVYEELLKKGEKKDGLQTTNR